MTLRLAVVGLGQIGRAHAARIQASAECCLAGLASPTTAAGPEASAFGAPLFADLGALLAAVRPDGVILATPNALHLSGALMCIAAGLPVLVEKPIADNLANAQQLVDAARRAGVPVLVGHHRRYSASLEAAQALIDSGRLGRLVAVTGSATFVKPASYFAEAPWRSQPGGGPMLINLVHEIDNLRALLREQAGEIVAVQAMASNATRGGAVEDTAVINLRFASGLLGSFLLSDTAASPHSWEQTSGENTAYDHHADQDCYMVAGTQGSLQVPSLRLYRYADEASWWQPLKAETPVAAGLATGAAAVDPLDRQLAHFCAVIRAEAPPRVSAESALRTLQVTLAVAEAAHTGQLVQLPPALAQLPKSTNSHPQESRDARRSQRP